MVSHTLDCYMSLQVGMSATSYGHDYLVLL